MHALRQLSCSAAGDAAEGMLLELVQVMLYEAQMGSNQGCKEESRSL
jgi:hypothetical protein